MAYPPTQPLLRFSRQKYIESALERQTRECKEAFREYASRYYRVNNGTAADVVAAYKRTSLPKPVGKDFRCTGGIFQAMLRRGEIRSTGTVKAADGSGRNMDCYSATDAATQI